MGPLLTGGWRVDPPSDRDYDLEHEAVRAIAEHMELRPEDAPTLPTSADLRDGFGPPGDQGPLNSCSSFAAAALFEHGMKRQGRHAEPGSPLFLYKVQRDLMSERGDNGSYLRTAMEALALAGVCPERYWPYDPARLDHDPPAFCYAVADNYEASVYYRLDHPEQAPTELLRSLKVHLARGLPVMFGCALFPSLDAVNQTGMLAEPGPNDPIVLLHAFVAAGYDDEKVVCDVTGTVRTGRGAVLVRSSWGLSWGEQGHAWLPYSYVLKGMTRDYWVLVSSNGLNRQQFEEIYT
ncbi:MAG: C1 family peptidase [Myxococcota bacterium]